MNTVTRHAPLESHALQEQINTIEGASTYVKRELPVLFESHFRLIEVLRRTLHDVEGNISVRSELAINDVKKELTDSAKELDSLISKIIELNKEQHENTKAGVSLIIPSLKKEIETLLKNQRISEVCLKEDNIKTRDELHKFQEMTKDKALKTRMEIERLRHLVNWLYIPCLAAFAASLSTIFLLLMR